MNKTEKIIEEEIGFLRFIQESNIACRNIIYAKIKHQIMKKEWEAFKAGIEFEKKKHN